MAASANGVKFSGLAGFTDRFSLGYRDMRRSTKFEGRALDSDMQNALLREERVFGRREELNKGTLMIGVKQGVPKTISMSNRSQCCGEAEKLGSAGELETSKERRLAERIKLGDSSAQQELIVANLGLVSAIARKYVRPGLSREDLVQEGSLGLIRASQDFDPDSHGVQFVSYASLWIRSFIYRALVRDGSLIRVPRARRVVERHQPEEVAATSSEHGDWEACDRSKAVKSPVDRRVGCRRQSALGSTKRACTERMKKIAASSAEMNEIVSDSLRPEEILFQGEDYALLSRALATLSVVEVWVIYHRFGLDWLMLEVSGKSERTRANEIIRQWGLAANTKQKEMLKFKRRSSRYHDLTYKELGRRVGLSKYRVRQIEQIAVGKLRDCLESNRMTSL
jgi:RNA polymerase primary sigma factor